MSLEDQDVTVLAIFGEAVLYGALLFMFMFVLVLRLGLQGSKFKGRSGLMIVLSAILFVDSTIHMTFAVVQSITQAELMSKVTYILPLHIAICDGLLVWKVKVIRGSKKSACLPFCIWLATIVGCAMHAVVDVIRQNKSYFFSLPTSVMTIANTILCVCLISNRLGEHTRMMLSIFLRSTVGSSLVVKFYRLMVENGVLYVLSHVIAIVVAEIHPSHSHIYFRMLVPLLGILHTGFLISFHYHVTSDTMPSVSAIRFGTTASRVMEPSSSSTLKALQKPARAHSHKGRVICLPDSLSSSESV